MRPGRRTTSETCSPSRATWRERTPPTSARSTPGTPTLRPEPRAASGSSLSGRETWRVPASSTDALSISGATRARHGPREASECCSPSRATPRARGQPSSWPSSATGDAMSTSHRTLHDGWPAYTDVAGRACFLRRLEHVRRRRAAFTRRLAAPARRHTPQVLKRKWPWVRRTLADFMRGNS